MEFVFEEKTLVFLDVENCLIPTDFDAKNLAQEIKNSLRAEGYNGPVEIRVIAAHEDRLKAFVRDVLESREARDSGVTLKTLGEEHKQASDEEIVCQMFSLLELSTVPSRILLVSGDKGFTEPLAALSRFGFTVLVASRPSATFEELKELAVHYWEWRALLGLPPSVELENKAILKLQRRMAKTKAQLEEKKKKKRKRNDRHDEGGGTYLTKKAKKKQKKLEEKQKKQEERKSQKD